MRRLVAGTREAYGEVGMFEPAKLAQIDFLHQASSECTAHLYTSRVPGEYGVQYGQAPGVVRGTSY